MPRKCTYRGEQHHWYKPKDMELIRSLRQSGKTCREIGEAVGVSGSLISLLLKKPKSTEPEPPPAMVEHKRGPVQLSGKDILRFWSKVQKTDSCWLYTKLNPNGYGYFTKTITKNLYSFLSHRVSWMLKHGPISKDVLVCHDCPGGDNRSCVNPDHLFIGTHLDNIHDMMEKGRARKNHGEHNVRSFFTDKDIPNIRAEYLKGGTSYSKMAKRYSCGPNAIRSIVIRRTWKHIP